MTRQLAWVSVLLISSIALLMLLVGLAFVPVVSWPTYIPVFTLCGVACAVIAGLVIEYAGERLLKPLRRLAHSVEEGELEERSLRELLQQAPTEVAPLLYGLYVTQTRLRRSISDLEQERTQVAAIYEHMADSVIVLDRQERIVLCNPAARRMLRCTTPLGRTLAEVSRDADLVELARGAATGHAQSAALIELNGFGERRSVQATATVLPEDRRLLVLQDLSELRRAEVARRDFVANVSHELRTPVAALKALVETLEEGAIDDPIEGPAFLHRMHVEVDGLAQLVAELLDLARAEAGRLDLYLEPCRMDDLVRGAAERVTPTAKQTELQVDVTVDDAADLWVCADPRRIGQVLSNLLGNAAKFTPPYGRIEAGVRRAGDRVQVWVSDTGVGIERDHLGRIFERFYKSDPARAAGTGTGLGLAIAKHLVLAHGGQIWAESEGPGRGSTFRFELPLADVDAV